MNASLIQSKFSRSRPSLKITKLWKETGTGVKEVILKNITLAEDEVPIISCYNNQQWWLLSNKSLFVMSSAGANKYPFKDFIKIEISNEIYEDPVCKYPKTIRIFINNGFVELFIEPLSWAVIYSILKFVAGK